VINILFFFFTNEKSNIDIFNVKKIQRKKLNFSGTLNNHQTLLIIGALNDSHS